jgi:hypothetical protein
MSIEKRLAALSDKLASGTLEPQSSYAAAAEMAHAAVRRQSHFYFLKNLYRYPPRLLGQNLANFVRNRARELRGLPPASR